MLKSTKLFQTRHASKLFGIYTPNSPIVRFTSTQPQKHLTADQPLPDPAKAITKNKMFHYSTMGLAVCLPASLLLPASGLTFVTDCVLGVVLPAHLYFGLNAVINDYIYQPFVRKTFALGSIILSGIVGIGVLVLAMKHDSFGSVIRRLWTK